MERSPLVSLTLKGQGGNITVAVGGSGHLGCLFRQRSTNAKKKNGS